MNRKIGKALVVGAGISGIRAALDLAETGYGVTLIDRADHIGGILSQLDFQFPTNGCGMCKMLPLVERDASSQFCLRKGLFHENIDLRLSTRIVSIEGQAGHFIVMLRKAPTGVDPQRCVGCGLCRMVCPVEAPEDFNAGLGVRKAIYLPVPHTIPNTYVIDGSVCNHCGECRKVCPTGAIDLAIGRWGGFRILVVDDELIVRESLRDTLREDRFQVEAAESGAQALEMLAAESFHLMLTDIKMPGMDGVELLKAAKAAHPDLSVLMMTAYAAVETAVEAMKIGALDYLVKPFDPDVLIPMVIKVAEAFQAAEDQKLDVGAIVLCGGTGYFDPGQGKNPYGYGINPHVLTSLEFERLLSGAGPTGGRLVRPHDGRPVAKVGWLQCVGSRDLQAEADYCSSVCCMFAVKEAMLAKDKAEGDLDAAVFYTDMRTFGKPFERYRLKAEKEYGIRFERGRIHTVTADPETGSPVIRYVALDGSDRLEIFDLLVLAVGQRPSAATHQLAELAGLGLNSWGFVDTTAFHPGRTATKGITVGGSFTGLREIGESVIHASAAALEASAVIHAAGGGLALKPGPEAAVRDVSRQLPKVLIGVCTCQDRLSACMDRDELEARLAADPAVDQVLFVDRLCTAGGWDQLEARLADGHANRLLIGACHPYLFAAGLRKLARRCGLDPALMDVAQIWHATAGVDSPQNRAPFRLDLSPLYMGLARIQKTEPKAVAAVPVVRSALVVGGGIAGMTAALSIADHGFPVVLVEKAEALGGNLRWLQRIVGGADPRALLTETVQQVKSHPRIRVLCGSRVASSEGQVGRFITTVENAEAAGETIEHGVVVLATGGREAPTQSYGYGTSGRIVTQKELETKLASGELDPGDWDCVVMIQCVDSREEPRNYCSRLCCTTAMKHALHLKAKYPQISIYVLYRDIMTYGFNERFFTEARRAGVIFIPYNPADKPQVAADGPTEAEDNLVRVIAKDPILGRPIEVEADLVVLATGVVSELPSSLAAAFGAETDADGFFAEAESKWRPVDGLKEGVFACGLALSPRSIPESVATAGAAAQRCLKILSREKLPGAKVVAMVRHSLCSLCERCIAACPYHARSLGPDLDRVLVNAAMCQGCGDCAAECPNGAAVLQGFSDPQMLDVIDAALDGI
jgi:heterodisulfide reductase subunit A